MMLDRTECRIPCGSPTIGKDGWYMLNDYSWFEYEGQSYVSFGLTDSFKYRLKILDTVLLTNEQIKTLRHMLYTLPKTHSELKKQITNTLRWQYDCRALRNTSREAAKMMLTFRKNHATKKMKRKGVGNERVH